MSDLEDLRAAEAAIMDGLTLINDALLAIGTRDLYLAAGFTSWKQYTEADDGPLGIYTARRQSLDVFARTLAPSRPYLALDERLAKELVPITRAEGEEAALGLVFETLGRLRHQPSVDELREAVAARAQKTRATVPPPQNISIHLPELKPADIHVHNEVQTQPKARKTTFRKQGDGSTTIERED
jgi:hypothetical protein